MIRLLRTTLPFASILATTALFAACSGGSGGGDEAAEDGESTGTCADEKEFFRSQVWPTSVGIKCIACHNESGPGAKTRFVLKDDPAALDENLAKVRKLAREDDGDGPLLVKKALGKASEGHGGGAVLSEGTPEASALATFAQKARGVCEATAKTTSLGDRRVRRLTRDEYDHTLVDLLGTTPGWGEKLPADPVVGGFDTNGDALTVGSLFADKARANAEEIAKGLELSKVLPCRPSAGKEAECAAAFVQKLGERAFRRPVTEGETKRYAALYETIAKTDGFEGGVRAVLTAFLQSPSFLYRTELGTTGQGGLDPLTPYEIASELSYAFWKTMPDDRLFELARKGELTKPEVVAAEARRLLASPKSEAFTHRFVEQWLEVERLDQAEKDKGTYADFDPALRKELKGETLAFFDAVVRNAEGTFVELLTADYSYLSPKVATFYGLAPGAAGETGYAKAKTPGRLGILSHASVLATAATPSSASPVRRGKLVREKLLCQPLAPPPPGIAAQLPPVDPKLPNRARFQQHSADQACAGCHKLMDPVGFGFEGFDGVGKPVSGVDVSGELIATGDSDGTFQGVADLAQKLAASDAVRECFVRQWIRFSYGVTESEASATLAKSLASSFGASGTKLTELLVALTQTDHFFRRRSEALPEANAGAPAGPTPPPAPTGASTAPAPPSSPPPSPSPAAPPPTDVTVSVVDSPQTNGGQKQVTVTSTSPKPVDWKVRLPKLGTITNAWNTDVTVEGNEWVFVGKDYNRTLQPGGSTTFGFIYSN